MDAENDTITQYAQEHFNIKYLFPYQRFVIANVLEAFDMDVEITNQVVILPTGAGKSLCFQLPAAFCPGPTVVVYPLLGLMADQSRRLEQTELCTVVIKGGMDEGEKNKAFELIKNNKAKIIITNPESLAVDSTMKILSEANISHFVIDEAHCVAEWGDSFRPSYLELGKIIQAIKPRVTTAFTATASPVILERLSDVIFEDRPWKLVSSEPDRPNIQYSVIPALSMNFELRQAIKTMQRPLIVFAASRPGVEILAENISNWFPNIDCKFYHAELEKKERKHIEDWFMKSDDAILCSTCAYGMGMDKANIRTIIHYGEPSSVEAYMQESGRAGRDGQTSNAVLIRKACASDYVKIESNNFVDTDIKTSRVETMKKYAITKSQCRRTLLLKALGYEDADTVACSGCDVCLDKAVDKAMYSDIITLLARKHPRRFTIYEAALFLNGTLDTMPSSLFAAMSNCTVDEIKDMIQEAINIGIIDVKKQHPWKHKIIASKLVK